MMATIVDPLWMRSPVSVDIAIVDAPVTLDQSRAAEYIEFLQLKENFEADPKVYRASLL